MNIIDPFEAHVASETWNEALPLIEEVAGIGVASCLLPSPQSPRSVEVFQVSMAWGQRERQYLIGRFGVSL